MKRRRLLQSCSAIGFTVSLSGCLSALKELSPNDSDGDGVSDDQDYAPNDPSVQSRNDVVTRSAPTPSGVGEIGETYNFSDVPTTTQSSPTVTETEEIDVDDILNNSDLELAGKKQEEDLPQSDLPDNTIVADYISIGERTSHLTSYSLQSASVSILPETISRLYFNGAKLLIGVLPYPDEILASEHLYGYGLSEAFELGSTEAEISADLNMQSIPSSSFYLVASLVPADETLETLSPSDSEKVAESNRLRIHDQQLISEEPDTEMKRLSTESFSRMVGEGIYLLEFDGETQLTSWDANLVIYKSGYVDRSSRIRNLDRGSYVETAQQSGLANNLSSILNEEARRNEFETKRERLEFIIDFVQNLPYVPDDVSTAFDDYTKSVVETLAEGGGDCEDSAILMASLLQAEPLNYDCVLVQPPGHMAVGVYGNDLPGRYYTSNGRRYYYLETTGDDWSVGEMPREYSNEEATIHHV